MSESEQKQPENAKEKPKKEKSFLETVREIDSKERQMKEQAYREQQKREAEQAYQMREAYSEQLEADKRELIRHKHGLVEEADTIFEQPEEKKHYSVPQRIGNFFYHNKWWLGIASFFVLVGGFLVYDYAVTEDPDLVILMLTLNDSLYQVSDSLCSYAEQYIEDYNDDGDIIVEVHYIPISNDATVTSEYYQSNITKLTVEYQSADAMLLIADEGAAEAIAPELTLTNLEALFPDNEHVSGYGYYLKDTSFADRIGYDGAALKSDLYLGIRMPQKLLYCKKSEMQAQYDLTFPLLAQMISDFDTAYQPPESEIGDALAS